MQQGEHHGRRIRVVVVDDSDPYRAGIVRAVRKRGELELVGEANGGFDGLRLVESLRPDVLLCDVRMPGLDGLALVERLRLGPASATRCVLVSAYDDPAAIAAAMRAGADAFLPKGTSRLAICDELVRLGLRRAAELGELTWTER